LVRSREGRYFLGHRDDLPRHGDTVSGRSAGSGSGIAGVSVRAAVLEVIAAGSLRVRAASVGSALSSNNAHAAASGLGRASGSGITDDSTAWGRSRGGRRSRRRSGRRSRGTSLRVGSSLGDTADSGRSNISLHENVSINTPSCTPRVLDNVVVFSRRGISSVTNSEDTVVKLGSARGIEDTSRVGLESGLIGFNSNRYRLSSDGLDEGILIIGRDILESSEGSNVVGFLGGVTLSISGSVSVVSFRVNSSVLDDVSEGVVHESSVASHVSRGLVAIDELLLREGNELSVGDEVGTLGRTGGGEGPARTTLSLVLDISDGTSSSPVNRVVGGLVSVHEFGGSVLEALSIDLKAKTFGSEFFPSHIREFVNTKPVRIVLAVVLLEESKVVLEVLESGVELKRVFVTVGLVVGVHENTESSKRRVLGRHDFSVVL